MNFMSKILHLNKWFFIILFGLYFLPAKPINVVIVGLGSVLTFGWIYAVSIYGQQQVKKENLPSSNTRNFKMAFMMLPALIGVQFLLQTWLPNKQNVFGAIVFVTVVLTTIFVGFYLYFFAAKTITTLERKRKVTWNDCYFNFACIALNCLGIFILQPKVQQLLGKEV